MSVESLHWLFYSSSSSFIPHRIFKLEEGSRDCTDQTWAQRIFMLYPVSQAVSTLNTLSQLYQIYSLFLAYSWSFILHKIWFKKCIFFYRACVVSISPCSKGLFCSESLLTTPALEWAVFFGHFSRVSSFLCAWFFFSFHIYLYWRIPMKINYGLYPRTLRNGTLEPL